MVKGLREKKDKSGPCPPSGLDWQAKRRNWQTGVAGDRRHPNRAKDVDASGLELRKGNLISEIKKEWGEGEEEESERGGGVDPGEGVPLKNEEVGDAEAVYTGDWEENLLNDRDEKRKCFPKSLFNLIHTYSQWQRFYYLGRKWVRDLKGEKLSKKYDDKRVFCIEL